MHSITDLTKVFRCFPEGLHMRLNSFGPFLLFVFVLLPLLAFF